MEQPKAKDLQSELETALVELEQRVDRLRASYEQYFLGYEKIEPGVLRKDVDRRFTALRKHQIRNTALRFRFNVITQRFNTYSMYWTRICRQIEEGTYKRHVVKAARRFGKPSTPSEQEQDWSIDVELGDLEDADIDAILAEVDAATEAYDRTSLTVDAAPPGATGDGPSSERAPASNQAPRAMRHAALPPGAKPPMLVRRRSDGDKAPPSMSQVGPSSDRGGPPSSSVVRPSPSSATSVSLMPAAAASTQGAPPSAGRPAPASARTPASSMSPQAPRAHGYRPAALPPSATRVPVALSSTPRMSTAPNAQPPESAKLPGSRVQASRAPAPVHDAGPRSERSRPLPHSKKTS